MSYYTNDTDTLRQMISQSLPQVVSAAVTVVTVLVSMLSLSLYLTAFAILYVCPDAGHFAQDRPRAAASTSCASRSPSATSTAMWRR